jgi:lysophospholipase L1-like esterase
MAVFQGCARFGVMVFGVASYAFGGTGGVSSQSAAPAEALVVGTIGDSISVAFNSANWGSNRALSWASGNSTSVHSIAQRLGAVTRAQVQVANFAITGASARDLPGQVDKVMSSNPSYVTLLIGPNDLCEWKEQHGEQLQRFESEVRSAIRTMVEKKSDVKILMSAIPDMVHLYEIGKEKGCDGRWAQFRICQNLLSPGRTDMDRQKFHDRWQDANDRLATVAREFPEHVEFMAGAQNYKFTTDDLSSKDCFHPSPSGQSVLAKEAWASRFFDEYR